MAVFVDYQPLRADIELAGSTRDVRDVVAESANAQPLGNAVVVANFRLAATFPEVLDALFVVFFVEGGARTKEGNKRRNVGIFRGELHELPQSQGRAINVARLQLVVVRDVFGRGAGQNDWIATHDVDKQRHPAITMIV